MPEAQATPPVSPRSPSPISRLLHALRFFRVFLKKAVYLPLVATLLIGLDAWVVVAIDGWEGDAENLRAEATKLGQSIGAVNASIKEAEAEIAMLSEQQVAAASRADEVAAEAAVEQALSDAVRDAALDLEKCATDRLKVVQGLWEHGSAFVATLNAEANRECNAAQANFDRLVKELD